MIYYDKYQFCSAIQDYSDHVIAVDYGLNRIGIAICRIDVNISLPKSTIVSRNLTSNVEKIIKISNYYNTQKIILGLPLKNKVKDHYFSLIGQIDLLASLLSDRGYEICFWDEQYSSRLAQRRLRQTHLKRKIRDSLDDQVSAQIFLEEFLFIMHSKFINNQVDNGTE